MLKILITINIVLFLCGCSRTIEYYEYSSEEASVESRGTVRVGLVGEFSEDDSLFEKKTIKGNPYSLSISFIPSSDIAFCVRELILSQGELEKAVDLVGDRCGKDTSHEGFEVGTKLYFFEKVDNIKLGEPVKVTITGTLGSDDSKEVVVELTSKYKTEETNDFLDRILSV